MDMHSRNQYLKKLQEDYLKASKGEKSKLLDEAVKRTGLVRKHLIVKLSVKSRLSDKQKYKQKRKRKQYYDSEVKAALVKCWRIFDRPCGQRLKTLLETEVDRLRLFNELICSDLVAKKLKKISFRTIDKKLKHEKEIELLKRKYHQKNHPLLYHKIPTKTANEFNRNILGQIQTDLVEHCGTLAAGEFINTLTNTDVFSGWCEQEAIMGRGQYGTFNGLTNCRKRSPFDWNGIHSDNDTTFINWHLFNYCLIEEIEFSRSRPFKKNDNCFVEQKNSSHVRQVVGYLRYDTPQEQQILNSLYRNELRLYKNFFQPVMKLKEKIRIKGKIYKKYDKPKTPYHRLLESDQISEETKQQLTEIYNNLNPAELKRNIDKKLKLLYQSYQTKKNIKHNISKVELTKKLKPISVR